MAGEIEVAGYTEMVEERLVAGWLPSLLTFMFQPLGGSERAVRHRQRRIVEEVYARHVTRVARHPRARSQQGKLPVWICVPDYPVPKHAKSSLREVAINDGQHVHAVGLLPPKRRVVNMADHVEQHQELYTGVEGLMRLHAEPFTHDVGHVVGYTFKMIARHRVDPDAVFILPRAHSEVTRGPDQCGRDTSIFSDGTGP